MSTSSLLPAQSAAVLHLLQRLLRTTQPAAAAALPTSLDVAAADGSVFYGALNACLPSAFPPMSAQSSAPPDDDVTGGSSRGGGGAMSAAVHDALVRGMSTVLQSSVEGVDGSVFVLATIFPRLRAAASATSPAAEQALWARCVVMTIVLGGSQAALQELKQLPREDQVALSNMAKQQLQQLALKPRPRSAAAMVSDAAPTSSSPSTVASGSAAHTASLPPSTAAMVTDMSYYHNTTVQLRKELATAQSQLANVEARCQAAEQERDAWSRKYQLLLGDGGASSGDTTTSSVSAAATGAEAATAALLKQRCEEKDATIATLKSKVEEQTTRMAAFKETLGMHEIALQALRRKLKLAEEGVMAKSTECRRLQEALSVSEDKLTVQLQARTECENTIESLRSQLTVLQLTVQEQEAMGSHDQSHMAGNLSGSFASNGSIDRVVVLENEMDDMRAQRDALQKQLSVLQRQVATLPAPVASADAVSDTLKAQVRLLEKEKEDLRQQLNTALAQVEAAAAGGGGQSAQGSLFATPPRRSSSRFSSAAAGSPNGEDADEDGGAGPSSSVLRGGVEGSVQRKQRNNTRRDQTILSSLLLEYGYQNLLLQQHNVLLHRDALDAAEAQARRLEENEQALAGPGGARPRGSGRAFSGSFLTRQRRDVEEGLLESIIHSRSRGA